MGRSGEEDAGYRGEDQRIFSLREDRGKREVGKGGENKRERRREKEDGKYRKSDAKD